MWKKSFPRRDTLCSQSLSDQIHCYTSMSTLLSRTVIPGKHETFTKCWFNVGSPYASLAQQCLKVSCLLGSRSHRIKFSFAPFLFISWNEYAKYQKRTCQWATTNVKIIAPTHEIWHCGRSLSCQTCYVSITALLIADRHSRRNIQHRHQQMSAIKWNDNIITFWVIDI